MEDLHGRYQVSRHALHQAYGAVFMSAITSLEGMIEELFLKLLLRRVASPRGIHPRVTFQSDRIARDIVLGGRNYVDWLPYEERTIKRAKAFFAGGRPFTQLTKVERDFLRSVYYIRNAIAHQSRHAKRVFEDEVIGNTPLLPQERTPTGFLRSIHSTQPTVTRYEQIANELATLSHKLCRPTN